MEQSARFYKRLGRRLRALRRGLGLTEIELSDDLSIDPSIYKRYERGESAIPPHHLLALAELTGRPVGYIVTGRDDGEQSGERSGSSE